MKQEQIIRFLQCRTSRQEEKDVLDWIDSSPDNRKEFDRIDALFSAVVLNAPRAGKRTVSAGKRIFKAVAAVAASVVIAVLCGHLYSSAVIDEYSRKMVAVTAPKGQMLNIELYDGTEVWLSGGTRLEYPVAFAGESRHVSLSGEAMFDVTSQDGGLPFVVETFAGDIKVLGTKFNVLADSVSKTFSAALLRGRIMVESGLSGEDLELRPGEIAFLSGGRMNKGKIEDESDYLWIDGIIALNSESFAKLKSRLEKAYDVTIHVLADEEPRIRNRGKVHISDGLEHVLRITLADTGYSYEIDYDAKQVYIR